MNNYVNEKGELLQPNAQPGDVRFVDVTSDGVINDQDRTKIGKGMPDWTFGFSLGAEWKGFDLSLSFKVHWATTCSTLRNAVTSRP